MILDMLDEMRAKDPFGMLRLVHEMPQHIEKAVVLSSAVPVGIPKSGYKNVIVGGMGGSAIAGDLLKTVAGERTSVPCAVVRQYTSPRFGGPESLFFCSSYSGNTEETLSLYDEAKSSRASIVCLGSGGELERRALLDGVPFLKMEQGIPPRAAIGYSFFMMYEVLRRVSVLPDEAHEIEETISLLRKKEEIYSEHIPTAENPAKKLASTLHSKLISIYGSRLTSAAAFRWKCQFNENSKALAFANEFPELNHNEIVGWRGLRALRVPAEVVALRDPSEHARVSRRIAVTLELAKKDGAGTIEVWSEGKSLVTRIFSLIYLGDFASIYLAFLYGEDPTPVVRIDELKRKLSEESC